MNTFYKKPEQISQYSKAKRAIQVTDFPTIGYYFIKSIREEKDLKGNIFPVATVEWKPNETDGWVDTEEVKYLRLDYLFGEFCERPDTQIIELKNKIIYVNKSFVSFEIVEKAVAKNIVANWELVDGVSDSKIPPRPENALPREERLKIVAKELLSKPTNFVELFGHLDEDAELFVNYPDDL
ncbi:MAG TPA: hypothetical protein VL442_11695 [Mucilaginibacter sp.]|jgi:hypothetical protein|nr:hypothetical protein [Mucilaginibacter sp.]